MQKINLEKILKKITPSASDTDIFDKTEEYLEKYVAYFRIARIQVEQVYLAKLNDSNYFIDKVDEEVRKHEDLLGWYNKKDLLVNQIDSVLLFLSIAAGAISRPYYFLYSFYKNFKEL